MATLVELAAQLVSSHASATSMSSDEVIAEIQRVHAALKAIESGQSVEAVQPEGKPSLTVKEAFKKNEVVCMICGKGGFKTLTRHLSTAHVMKPGEYRKQFGIPSKQSLSAKSYSESRRQMAQDRGLADNLAKAREVRMANIEAKKAAPAKAAKRGRPPKAVLAQVEVAVEAAKPVNSPEKAMKLAKAEAPAKAAKAAKTPAKATRKAKAAAKAPAKAPPEATAPEKAPSKRIIRKAAKAPSEPKS